VTVSNFVCTECGASKVLPRDQFTEAIEYRRIDSQERLHRRTLRLICRRCVLEIKAPNQTEAML
jgi:hypothetical protein